MPVSSSSSTNCTLVQPRLACRSGKTEDPIECSLHTLPKPLVREFAHVFGEKYLDYRSSGNHYDGDEDMIDGGRSPSDANGSGGHLPLELLAIPTNQQARHDLVAVGEQIEAEKDRLLNCFMDFADEVCAKIRGRGFWADFIDPCSGLPMLTRDCNKVYSEVDGMECLLNYRAHNAGFCKVLTHPKWGSAVYPATMFCYAPRDVVVEILAGFYIKETFS